MIQKFEGNAVCCPDMSLGWGSGDLGFRQTQYLLLYITRFITFITFVTLLDLSTVE